MCAPWHAQPAAGSPRLTRSMTGSTYMAVPQYGIFPMSRGGMTVICIPDDVAHAKDAGWTSTVSTPWPARWPTASPAVTLSPPSPPSPVRARTLKESANARKKKKVTLCRNRQTIQVTKKKKQKHLQPGDTEGPCPPPARRPPAPGAARRPTARSPTRPRPPPPPPPRRPPRVAQRLRPARHL